MRFRIETASLLDTLRFRFEIRFAADSLLLKSLNSQSLSSESLNSESLISKSLQFM